MVTRLSGQVVKGEGRGRTLGFPTANLAMPDRSPKPPEGIYAARAYLPAYNARYRAALHIGPRPVFGESTPSIEVHLLDFPDRDLYGEELQLFDITFLRPIKNFASEAALIGAIDQDCRQVRAIFENA